MAAEVDFRLKLPLSGSRKAGSPVYGLLLLIPPFWFPPPLTFRVFR